MKKLIILLTLALALTGCPIIVPFVDSYHESGHSSSSRQELLDQRLRIFFNVLSDRHNPNFTKYLNSENKREVLNSLRAIRKDTNIVDAEIEFIDYDEKFRVAEVEILMKRYKTPYYIVNDVPVTMIWKFVGSSSGWRLSYIQENK